MKDNLDIIKADTIEQYNKFFGFETRHPLVGIVHFDQSVPQPTHKMTLGFYALFLKNYGSRSKKGEFLRFELSHNALNRKPQK